MASDNRPEKTKSVSQSTPFQNGGAIHATECSMPGLLHGQGGFEGRLSNSSSVADFHCLLAFQNDGQILQFQTFPFRFCIASYVTGFWKTDRMSHWAYSILLAQLMPTLIHYTFALPLSGLVDWSAFLE